MKNRDTYVRIWEDLADDKSMIFLVGPRQAGKTTLAQIISDLSQIIFISTGILLNTGPTSSKIPIFSKALCEKIGQPHSSCLMKYTNTKTGKTSSKASMTSFTTNINFSSQEAGDWTSIKKAAIRSRDAISSFTYGPSVLPNWGKATGRLKNS